MSPQRIATQEGACYDMRFGSAQTVRVQFAWPQQIDLALESSIIELMRLTTASAPIIGFAQEISDVQASHYLDELRSHLAAGKCRLLTIVADGGTLIGLCTLRRNLNPNNAHITDLAKGMILESFRGGLVLPAAFHEMALKCEADAVDVLTLDVRAGTPAYRAWQRFGFETYGTMPDYARAQGETHAGHFMMQRVSDLKARALVALRAATAAAAQG